MNKQRRKRIEDLISQLEQLATEIEGVRDDEQEAFDNLPESIQGSGKGELSEQAIENLDEAKGLIDDAICSLQNSIEQ